jgi:hypothetical protein
MAWLCLKDNTLAGSQMCIVTGPRIDLAIALIDRMKKLFAGKIGFSTQELRLFLEEMKQLLFGLHLPVMEFSSCRSSIRNNSGNNNKKNGEKEKQQQSFTREQILSIAIKAECIGYDSLSVNDHIVFRTSWLDALSTLSGVVVGWKKKMITPSLMLQHYRT